MAFLFPAILAALAAIILPILIHLFNLRKVQKVEFSTLMFLKELQKSKLKRIKLLQLILLILRILLIAFLVFLFARPVIKSIYASNSEKQVIIVVDDSFSMSAKDENGEYIKQAKDAIMKIASGLNENDELYFIPSSKTGMHGSIYYCNTIGDLIDSANSLTIKSKSSSLSSLLENASQQLKKGSSAEIYVVSDFQTSFIKENPGPYQSFEDVNMYFVKIGKREPNNLSLNNFKLKTQLLEKNRRISFTVILQNHSLFNVQNKIITLTVNNKFVTERAADIGSSSQKVIEFTFTPPNSDIITGMLELKQEQFQDDEISHDNKLYFSIVLPQNHNAAIVGRNGSGDYIKTALQSAMDIASDSSGVSSLIINNYNGLQEASGNNMMFITGIDSFSPEDVNFIKGYLNSGNGVVLTISENADISSYNNLLNAINAPVISALSTNASDITFDRINFEHPLLADVFSNRKLSYTTQNIKVSSPQIFSYAELSSNDKTNSLIILSNNRPFFAETELSNGRFMILAVDAKDKRSDFYKHPLFAPLMHRGVLYASGKGRYLQNFTLGTSAVISAKVKSGSITSSSSSLSFTNAAGEYLTIPYNQFSSEAGIYLVKDSSGNTISAASLNLDETESNLKYFSETELRDKVNDMNIEAEVIYDNTIIQSAVTNSREGYQLWRWLFFFSLAALAAEMFLSKKLEKGNFKN